VDQACAVPGWSLPGFKQLDIEFQAADAPENRTCADQRTSLEEGGRRVERRRGSPGRVAIDLDQRLGRRLDRVAAQVWLMTVPSRRVPGRKTLIRPRRPIRDLASLSAVISELASSRTLRSWCRPISLADHALKIGGVHFDLGDLSLLISLQMAALILRPECATSHRF